MFMLLLVVLLAIIAGFLIFVLLNLLWNQSYWRRVGLPSPPASFPDGHFFATRSNTEPGMLVLSEWTKKYGKTYGIYEGARVQLVTSDPYIIQQVFMKNFEDFYARKGASNSDPHNPDPRTHVLQANGPRWKRLRTISNQAFTTSNLNKIHPIIEASVLQLVKHFEAASGKDEPIDCYLYYQELTIHVICHLALGQTSAEMFKNPLSKHLTAFFQRDQRQWKNVLGMISPTIGRVAKAAAAAQARLTAMWWRQKKAGMGPFEAIDRQTERAVEDRRRQREEDAKRGMEPGEAIDFIDLFLDAESEDNSWESATQQFQRGTVSVSKRLTFDEIVAQCNVFLLAGFDTTANSLSYATFLLTKHSEVQRKLQEEIDKECIATVIGPEVLPRLRYLDCVVKESLRMFPLASLFSSRTCMRDTVVGDNIPLKQGMAVAADVWSLHYDKNIWGDDAAEFKPERWLSPAPNANLAAAWIPFGFGPRQCIGMRLALVEVKLTLCHLLKRFSFVAGPKTEEKLQLFGSVTVSPKAVHIYVKARE